MFEKDAEYYAKEKYSPNTDPFIIAVADDAFKDGAEFGYNKANEWHYVKDGDLPKAYQRCYFIYSNSYKDNEVIFSKSNINVLTGLYAFYLDEETGEETTDPCFYDDINDDEISPLEVYAWKEIVLPKEIE